MQDINVLRKDLAKKYSDACRQINHPVNKGFERVLMSPTVKSFYLDLIYRGNDKTNFNHRLADRDLILMAGILP